MKRARENKEIKEVNKELATVIDKEAPFVIAQPIISKELLTVLPTVENKKQQIRQAQEPYLIKVKQLIVKELHETVEIPFFCHSMEIIRNMIQAGPDNVQQWLNESRYTMHITYRPCSRNTNIKFVQDVRIDFMKPSPKLPYYI